MTWFRSVCYNVRMKIRRLLPIAVLAAAWTTLASSAFAARPAFTVKVASTNAVVAAATDNGLSVVHDGCNFDALYDFLTEHGSAFRIVIRHCSLTNPTFRQVCADAVDATPGLEISFS